MAGLRNTLENRLTVIAQQLGMSPEETQQLIEQARAAGERVGSGNVDDGQNLGNY
jgi:phage terminase small subunit